MDNQLAKDIIKMLPNDRTLFRYHQDRYAFMLLEFAMKEDMSVADIKASRFAKLLERPAVKDLMAQRGGGQLAAHDMALCWPIDTQSYVLSLGLWGSRKSKERDWHQTSRTGTNLVLQMNFDRGHDTAFQKLLGDPGYAQLACQAHPINRKGRTTMAWARIDLDLDTGEALIEELQNDWLRNALWELECANDLDTGEQRKTNLTQYVQQHLQPYLKMWSEAMLAATLFFLIKEIGIREMRKRLNDGKERFWKLAM